MYRPHIFKVTYLDDRHHRKPTHGGMDSEYSHTTREHNEQYIVAPDLETAQFLWDHQHRAVESITQPSWTEVGPVSIMIPDVYGV